jgi:uncharacterized protein
MHAYARAPMKPMYRMKSNAQGKSPNTSRARRARGAANVAPATNGSAVASVGEGDAGAGRRIQVRRSGIHGKGVFALKPIEPGETIIEYKGQMISWAEAQERHPHDPSDPNHTFFFHIDDEHVIDGKVNGNAARWINHACDPNCEADEENGRVFIKALQPIEPGEELFYDYGLIIDERYTAKLKREYACRCGSAKCRGTMLAPKR